MVLTRYAIVVRTGSGKAFVYDEHGASPLTTNIKMFLNIMDAFDYIKRYWYDEGFEARPCELRIEVEEL